MTAMKMSGFMTRLFAGRTKANIFVCSYANDRADAKKYPPRDMVTRRPDQIEKFLKQYDVAGRAVYFCVNTVRDRKRNKDEIAEINCLHVDIDFKGVVEKQDAIIKVLKGLKHKPSAVVSSGHGLHCYWLLQPPLGPEHIGSIEMILAKLAEVLAGDKSAAEIARVLRLPGSHNSKNDEWLEVEVVSELCSWSTYSVGLLDKWLHGQEPLLTYKSTKKEAVVEREKQSLNIWQQFSKETRALASGFDANELIEEMSFHDTTGHGIDDTHTRIVGAMVADDEPLEAVLEALHHATKFVYNRDRTRGEPPWSEKEFLSGVKAKYRYFKRKDNQKEEEASESPAQILEAKKVLEPNKKLNGHKHHDVDVGLPEEKEFWIAPYDFWGMVPTETLRRGMMPEIIENVAFEYSERTGMDTETLAMSMLTCCSSVIPTGIKVAAYNEADLKFIQSIRIWQANIGDAGSGKTPIIDAVLGPLQEINERLRDEYNREVADYANYSKEEQKTMDKPKRGRTLLPDYSTESAQQVFADNPHGLLGSFDELVNFFGSKSRYSNKSGGGEQVARGFWLSSYDSARFSSTRIQRGDIDCVPSLSIIGGIQPGVLHELIEEASRNDGLVQRFNPVLMPETTKKPNRIKEPKYPLTIYEQLIKKMYSDMPLRMSGAVLHFSPKAEAVRDRMFEWVDAHVVHFRASNAQLASHINKYKGMFLRYCGLFHMIENYSDKQPRLISAETANKVYRFMTSCRLKHAEAFYSLVKQNEENNDMKNIAEFILAHNLLKVSAREMQRGSSRLRNISTRDVAHTAGTMVALGWLKVIQGKRTDSFNWLVNPDVHRLFLTRAALIKERNAEAVERLKALKLMSEAASRMLQ